MRLRSQAPLQPKSSTAQPTIRPPPGPGLSTMPKTGSTEGPKDLTSTLMAQNMAMMNKPAVSQPVSTGFSSSQSSILQPMRPVTSTVMSPMRPSTPRGPSMASMRPQGAGPMSQMTSGTMGGHGMHMGSQQMPLGATGWSHSQSFGQSSSFSTGGSSFGGWSTAPPATRPQVNMSAFDSLGSGISDFKKDLTKDKDLLS